ncbi:PREDICTED: uncharacterized protein LOC109211484 [Nicotiana attenuata]|uniref:uncharacterized protein LOC109211484 n=1 Tax=Nicotiana attenuata TaxID=49451 RepID=UPI0009055133|nr:PREDICTED: uncharacterized protein LOC109211484 [Nicotiana attenuata]
MNEDDPQKQKVADIGETSKETEIQGNRPIAGYWSVQESIDRVLKKEGLSPRSYTKKKGLCDKECSSSSGRISSRPNQEKGLILDSPISKPSFSPLSSQTRHLLKTQAKLKCAVSITEVDAHRKVPCLNALPIVLDVPLGILLLYAIDVESRLCVDKCMNMLRVVLVYILHNRQLMVPKIILALEQPPVVLVMTQIRLQLIQELQLLKHQILKALLLPHFMDKIRISRQVPALRLLLQLQLVCLLQISGISNQWRI